jgi:5-deoxy-glucuronate isomerase
MLIPKPVSDFTNGYNSITEIGGKYGDMLLDFGLIRLNKKETYASKLPKERVFMLMHGMVRFHWDGNKSTALRTSLLDENPWALHVPQNLEIGIECLSDSAELCVERVANPTLFEPHLYTPEDIRSDIFGKGTMQETSTRTVRTVFDALNAPYSGMVLGEVINHPGKWSSYPPHDHPQPEIYHYRFFPTQGFGISILEDDAWIVHDGDTAAITPDKVHSQASAPGYAMYYIWMIPHLPHAKFFPDSRRFREEHSWLLEKTAEIWTDTKNS